MARKTLLHARKSRAPIPAEYRLIPVEPAPAPQITPSLLGLHTIEPEYRAAMDAVSQIDLYAAGIVHHTLTLAELIRPLSGWSPQLEEFDRRRRQQFLEAVRQAVAMAHAHILKEGKGRNHD